jgi:hypothetical protein|tara:strand:- start:175 stop:375 length:201 start_codon:yes stop_codon:yes gene_type:complete
MDTTKWKSILVPIDIYWRIREIAELEHRPIGSQLRVIFSDWMEHRHAEANALDHGQDSTAREVNLG